MFILSYTQNGVARRHQLQPRTTLVGRAPECDLLIEDQSISRSHAEFLVTHTACEVRDLGSLNGTYRNGRGVTRVTVVDCDILTLVQLPVQVDESHE